MTVANALNIMFFAPDGYEFTGEYRVPNLHETFLSTNGDEPIRYTWIMMFKNVQKRLILRKKHEEMVLQLQQERVLIT